MGAQIKNQRSKCKITIQKSKIQPIGPFGWNQRRNALLNIRFQIVHFVPLFLCASVPYEVKNKKQSQFVEVANLR